MKSFISRSLLAVCLCALYWSTPLTAAATESDGLTGNSTPPGSSACADALSAADAVEPPQDGDNPPQDSGDPPQDNDVPPLDNDDPPQENGNPPLDNDDPSLDNDVPPLDYDDPSLDYDDPSLDNDNPPQIGDSPQVGDDPSSGGDTGSAGLTFTETLDDCRITNGEVLHFTTISSSFADMQEPGYYPGELTVSIEGDIIVEAGGTLAIGTLSIGGKEASPVVTGSGCIIVEPGGKLQLTQAILQAEGGLTIIQQPGGSVLLQRTDPPDGMITWSVPLVQNEYDNPDDLWLEQGTSLTADMLPSSLNTTVQFQGSETDAALALVWDLSAYDGRTEGEEITLTGSFADETGQTLLSAVPLTLTVHWYAPEILAVTDAVWKGETVLTVQLTVQNLPDPDDFRGEIWGEVSTDGGQTWQRWDDEEIFFIVSSTDTGSVCVFRLPDETPRWFRIVAEDTWEHLYYRSEAIYLAYEEQEDSGGNRGGSTSPSVPDRQPTTPELPEEALPPKEELLPEEELPPEEEPSLEQELPSEETLPSEENLPQPEVSIQTPQTDAADAPAEPGSGTQNDRAALPAPQAYAAQDVPARLTENAVSPALSNDAVLPGPSAAAQNDAAQNAPRSSTSAAAPEPQPQMPLWAQAALGVGGVGVCAGVGLTAAGRGPLHRRK